MFVSIKCPSSKRLSTIIMHVFSHFRLPSETALNFMITEHAYLRETVLASVFVYLAIYHVIRLMAAIVLIVICTNLILGVWFPWFTTLIHIFGHNDPRRV